MANQSSQPSFLATALLAWYPRHQRDLPWRHTRDPYAIWLSEVILQQTRVAQGLPYYETFLRAYPTVQAMAAAPETEVLRYWQGLGYYSRARNMHRTARQVVEEYGGHFPDNYAGLLKLRGVGPYTAAAIASFAFDEAVAVLDGNVYRVLATCLGCTPTLPRPARARSSRPWPTSTSQPAPLPILTRPLWSLGPFSARRPSPIACFARCRPVAGLSSTDRWRCCR